MEGQSLNEIWGKAGVFADDVSRHIGTGRSAAGKTKVIRSSSRQTGVATKPGRPQCVPVQLASVRLSVRFQMNI